MLASNDENLDQLGDKVHCLNCGWSGLDDELEEFTPNDDCEYIGCPICGSWDIKAID